MFEAIVGAGFGGILITRDGYADAGAALLAVAACSEKSQPVATGAPNEIVFGILPAATSALLQKHRVKVRQRYRNVVETWFEAELDALPEKNRRKWLIAIATLVDWEMWQSLCTYPSRSMTEAKEALSLLLNAALRQMEEEARSGARR